MLATCENVFATVRGICRWRDSLRRVRDCAATHCQRRSTRLLRTRALRSRQFPAPTEKLSRNPDGRVWSPAFRPSGAIASGFRTASRPDSKLYRSNFRHVARQPLFRGRACAAMRCQQRARSSPYSNGKSTRHPQDCHRAAHRVPIALRQHTSPFPRLTRKVGLEPGNPGS